MFTLDVPLVLGEFLTSSTTKLMVSPLAIVSDDKKASSIII